METRAALSGHAAAVIADEAEALAFADLYAAAPQPLGSRLGLRVERVADATLLLAPGLPSSMFNRAIGLGLRQPASTPEVDNIAAAYRGAGCRDWWLHWNPHASPAGFPSRLLQMGFTQPARRSWAKVLRGAEPPPHVPTDLKIAPATDAQAAPAIQAIVEAFGMPGLMAEWLGCLHGRPRWRLYAATDGEDVVGGGCLFTAGELAWLGMGAIRASHRRRGGQGALMARRIADAAEAGARHVVTETGEPIADESNPSLGNMKRCGFATVASRLNFAGPA
ncbi:MAG TPA: GNAT family N-acetyltransferase [Ramlibacter sp.]|nr:GNAT family N-acetyltransferase [Ramlibacter sp.]